MAETSAINPYAYGAATGVDLITSIIGAIIQHDEVKKAQSEAREIDKRNYDEDVRRNRFSEGILKGQQKIQKAQLGLQQNKFALDAQTTGAALKQAEIQKLENLVNNNSNMRQLFLKNWSV